MSVFERYLRLAVKESAFEIADYASKHHRFKSRTTALENSLDVKIQNGGLAALIYANEKKAPYASYVHFGTKPHMILPRKRSILRWTSGNKFVFSKFARHPGWKEDPFLYNAVDASMKSVDEIFDRYVKLAGEEVATEITKG